MWLQLFKIENLFGLSKSTLGRLLQSSRFSDKVFVKGQINDKTYWLAGNNTLNDRFIIISLKRWSSHKKKNLVTYMQSQYKIIIINYWRWIYTEHFAILWTYILNIWKEIGRIKINSEIMKYESRDILIGIKIYWFDGSMRMSLIISICFIYNLHRLHFT